MRTEDLRSPSARPRRSLFQKYFAVLFAAVVCPLLVGGASEGWFGYRDQRNTLALRLRDEADAASARLQGFLDGIPSQLNWTTQTPWGEGVDERHRFDLLRLLRQAPAVAEVILLDGAGVERLHASRTEPDSEMSGVNRSGEPAFLGARASSPWWGPVTLHRGSEPYMTVAVAGPRAAAGVTIAQINLKFIWDVISRIHVGETGEAFVLDGADKLVAHPDINLVLGGEDNAAAAALRALHAAVAAADGGLASGVDAEGRSVSAEAAKIAGPDWTVIAEQPNAEAYRPIRATLERIGVLALAGAGFAAVLAYGLARRMTGPIKLLEEGAERIGAGQFDRRIEMRTGDELEDLARRFNQMAVELAVSKQRSERIGRLERFLSPEVAKLLDDKEHEGLLDSHRGEVAVVFCDLRGFTAFAGRAGPDEVMGVLAEYHRALGKIIVAHEATLTCYMGDGLMLLLNAPLPRRDPAKLAVRMAIEMQRSVQELIVGWRARGQTIGFGVGVAFGEATVGRIGYEGRIDYTAIGSVVNLASRLCDIATDGQVILDSAAAAAAEDALVEPLGARPFRGFPEPTPVFVVNPASDREALPASPAFGS
jgi:class 3 adenylate cyclase